MNHEITFFAKTNFRNKERIFGIKTDDRRKHVYVIGKTGMGKTTLLENMVIQDIQRGFGLAVVDPHGEFAEKILNYIPEKRIEDVIYINPADLDFPIALNAVEQVGIEEKHIVASGLIGVFKKIWADSWGPRLEYVLRNDILALLEYPGSTLLGMMRMLTDKEYRKKVVLNISDPVVKSFWEQEFAKYPDRFQAEAVAPIQNKVGQFLTNPIIRNIVGQEHTAINFRRLMDEKKILILNLSKGRIGEDSSQLLGSMLVTKLQLAAMSRVDIKDEEKRHDFYLYIDEFQNFTTESFANILSEARKYRLNLTLAHQYITQMPEEVRDAVFGNAGTLIAFRVGADDAEYLEKEFMPVFLANDLVNLPSRQIYLKLMIDGVAGNAFSATTLPPFATSTFEGQAEKIIEVSRQKYATPRAEVERKIKEWSGSGIEVGFDNAKNSDKFTDEKKPFRKTVSPKDENFSRKPSQVFFPSPSSSTPSSVPSSVPRQSAGNMATCSNCGKVTYVKFKPDPRRPVYCRKCLLTLQDNRFSGARPVSFSKEPAKVSVPTVSLSDAMKLGTTQFKGSDSRKERKAVDLEGLRSILEKSLGGLPEKKPVATAGTDKVDKKEAVAQTEETAAKDDANTALGEMKPGEEIKL